jgi:prevent-host-death family protein
MAKLGASRRWKIGDAKQHLSDVLRQAETEPQQILNRDRLVAAVIDAESFREFEAWRRTRRAPIAESFAELRRICAEEGYRLKTAPRRNRANPFADVLARPSR